MESDMVQHDIKDNQYIKKIILDIIGNNTHNINDIIIKVRKIDQSLSLKDIRDAIDELERSGIIQLYTFKGTFYNYLTKALTIWFTISLVTITLLTIFLFPKTEPYSIIRLIVGGIFILFIPGHSLLNLLFPKKERIIERIGLSITLSLITVTLTGLALNYMPIGIRLEPLVISLSIVSVPVIIIAEYRRYKSDINET